MTRREWLRAGLGCAGLCLAGARAAGAGAGDEPAARRGRLAKHPSPWFDPSGRGTLRCTLCPHACRLAEGQRGRCRVRACSGGRGVSLVYGYPCLLQIDPVERNPFFHVTPGARALSVSTAGCNLSCRFCEVWDMALVQPEDVYAYALSPRDIVEQALAAQARAVCFAFGEPVVFLEYMTAIARRAREAGLLALMHSGGYISPAPLQALCRELDGVNIDLKSFDPSFYRDVCGGERDAVLDTLRRIRAAGVHLEVTHLVIPSLNDSPEALHNLCRWMVRELGADTPLHFARFYPLYQLANLPPTPVATLDEARRTAREAGLHYAYVSRVPGHEGENTPCPDCGETVIRRMGFVVLETNLRGGRCGRCGKTIAGRWE